MTTPTPEERDVIAKRLLEVRVQLKKNDDSFHLSVSEWTVLYEEASLLERKLAAMTQDEK